MSEIDQFKEALRRHGSQHAYSEFVLGSDVWFFRNNAKAGQQYERYDRFKRLFSKSLGMPQNNIAIVGSAKLGFSLAPSKAFKPFDESSDVDIAIVSDALFRQSWDAFLELQSKYHLNNYQSIASNIFRRFVSLKKIDIRNSFFEEWARKVEPCKKDLQTIFHMPNEINYRIYQSWDAVERYHCNGLNSILRNLSETDDTQHN